MERQNHFYIQVAKEVFLILIGMMLCRLSRGYFLFPLIIYACGTALMGKTAIPWRILVFVLFTMNTSYGLIPKDTIAWALGLKVALVGISISLFFGSWRRKGLLKIPFDGMLMFLAAACFSLYDSWVPQISLLKIILFTVFILGIWRGCSNIHVDIAELMSLRVFFFALIGILVLGSIAVYPFPHISYATSFRYALREGASSADIKAMFDAMAGTTLFCGITNHSQSMAPMLAVSFSWLLCDTLFVERRFRWLHSIILLLILPLSFMTRSRVAFCTLALSIVVVYFYTKNKVKMEARLSQHLNRVMVGLVILFVVGAAILEVRNGTISRWVRKTDDVVGDSRSLSEALTSSRMGAVEMSMMEFRRNPIVGSGFQVAYYTKDNYDAAGRGLMLSASIEKGILFTMVLGETGIIGILAFAVFLVYFYVNCAIRRYYVTMTTFTTFLGTNLGEATFFSPSGCGGVQWLIVAVGGFVLDAIILTHERKVMALHT